MDAGRSWRWRLPAGIMLIAGLATAIGWGYFLHWAPSALEYQFQGVDLSQAAGQVDWPVVHADGADFAYVRATYGAKGRDAAFERHWLALPAAQMRRGAYLEYSLCQPAVDQANNFNTVVPRSDDALPPAVFVDFSPDCTARPPTNVVVGELARLLTMVENHTGSPVLLKISREFDVQYAISNVMPRPIWAIGNFFRPTYAARPWRMWQANDRRRIDGIAQPVHWDVVAP